MTTATYISHDQSGNIISVVSGSEGSLIEPEDLHINYTGPEKVTTDFYIKDGEPVQKPDAPSPDHVFNAGTELWEMSLDQGKIQAWTRIKKKREEYEFSIFSSGGYLFQCGSKSQQRIMWATQRAQADSSISIDWTLADNSTHTFTGTEFLEVGSALAAHVTACHAISSGLRVQIEAATTQAELDAIVW
tara:strand:- start:234 stop:800 length:567 start_codon:yes stop_codon:yes gene_type:complete